MWVIKTVRRRLGLLKMLLCRVYALELEFRHFIANSIDSVKLQGTCLKIQIPGTQKFKMSRSDIVTRYVTNILSASVR